MSFKKFVVLPLVVFCFNLHAAQTQVISTEEADIFIIRRVDIWSPSEAEAEAPRRAVKDRKFNFYYFRDDGRPGVVFSKSDGGIPDNPMARATIPEINRLGASAERTGNSEYFNQSSLINGKFAKPYLRAQNHYHREMVIQAGDPERLSAKVSSQSFFGNLLSLVSTVALARSFGGDVAVGVGSAAMDDIASLPKALGTQALPIALNGIDIETLPDYKLLEVKRIGPTPKMWANGQILIAYKTERTPELAFDLFVKAIPTALGVDTTVVAIDQARAADFQARKQIWAECVAQRDDRCK